MKKFIVIFQESFEAGDDVKQFATFATAPKAKQYVSYLLNQPKFHSISIKPF